MLHVWIGVFVALHGVQVPMLFVQETEVILYVVFYFQTGFGQYLTLKTPVIPSGKRGEKCDSWNFVKQ